MKNVIKKNKKYLFVLSDIIMILLSYCMLAIVRYDTFTSIPADFMLLAKNTAVLTITFLLCFFLVCRIYDNLWLNAHFRDYVRLMLVVIVMDICIFFVMLACYSTGLFIRFKYQLFVLFVTAVLVIGYRVFIKLVVSIVLNSNFLRLRAKRDRTLIVGAGAAAETIVRELNVPDSKFEIVGFVDDDEMKRRRIIYGYTVLGNRNDIVEICKKKNVNRIIIAIPSLNEKELGKILRICQKTTCAVRVLPKVSELIQDGRKMVESLRRVDIEDLLSREPIILDTKGILEKISGKTVLVTGGGGSIGSELCRQLVKFNPKKLIILDIYENNAYDIQIELKSDYPELDLSVVIASVRDVERLREVFDEFKPQIVFHAAAHKHVPLMEDSPGEAIKNNVVGTYNVALCADEFKVEKFVMISTDKAVNPTNVMGATKRMCEMIVQSMAQVSETDFVAVRFGNVLGSNGSVIPLFKKQIEKGGPVTLTHKEITRFFMTIPEAAQLVIQAASFANGGEIFVLDMGKPVKIYDLAYNLIKLSGYEPGVDIEIKITGLRPGEKLYEELLMDEEGLTNTSHKKIFIGKPVFTDIDTVKEYIKMLNDAVETGDNETIKDTIKKVVPTYKRNK